MTEEEKSRALKHFFGKFTFQENGCWLWNNAKRYGSFRLDGKVLNAHKASYLLFVGEVPDNLCVLHTCDTPGCVNPEHLFLGTNKDNTHDMFKKGRNRVGKPGDENWVAKERIKVNTKKKEEIPIMYKKRREAMRLMSIRLTTVELEDIELCSKVENISKSEAIRLLIQKGMVQYAMDDEE